MDYECQAIPIDKTLVDAQGQITPLCSTCLAPDCTNPIKEMVVSVFGTQQKHRLWVINNTVRQVVSCLGYVSTQENINDADL